MSLHLGNTTATIVDIKETPLTPFVSDAKAIISKNDLVGLTELLPYTFVYKKDLQSVSLPEGLTKIMKYNFYYCPNLKYIDFPSTLVNIENNYNFQYLNEIETIDLSKTKITSTPVVSNCYKLKTINLPNTISSFNSLGDNLFELENITINDSNNYEFVDNSLCTKSTSTSSTKTLYKATVNTSLIPNYVSNLYQSSFRCLNLKVQELIIPDNIKTIQNYVFYWTNNLKKLHIPSSITGLSNQCVTYLKDLEELTIDNFTYNSSNSLGYHFNYLPKLKTLNINKNWTGINNYQNNRIFLGSHSENGLTLNLGEAVASLPNYFLYSSDSSSNDSSNSIGKQYLSETYNNTSETLYTIKYGRTFINEINWNQCSNVGQYAFYGCKFNRIYIPPTITKLGNYAFQVYDTKEIYYDTNLTNSITTSSRIFYIMNPNNEIKLTIGSNVTSIPVNLFGNTSNNSYSTKMKYVYFTKDCKITSLPSQVFYNCSKLSEIVIPKTITTIGSNAFANCTLLSKIYYEGTVDEYNANVTKNDTTSYFVNAEVIPYSECCHDETTWHWDENNQFSQELTVTDWIIDKEAFYCGEGQKHGDCSVCGETIITTIPKKPVCDIEANNTGSSTTYYYWKIEDDCYKAWYNSDTYIYNNNRNGYLNLTLNITTTCTLTFEYNAYLQGNSSFKLYIYKNGTNIQTLNALANNATFQKLALDVEAGDIIVFKPYWPNGYGWSFSSSQYAWQVKNIGVEHIYGETVILNPATCTTAGQKQITCTVCNNIISDIYKNPHNMDISYSNGICQDCNETIYTLTGCNQFFNTMSSSSRGWYYDETNNGYSFKSGTSSWNGNYSLSFTVKRDGILKFKLKNNNTTYPYPNYTSSGYGYMYVQKYDNNSWVTQLSLSNSQYTYNNTTQEYLISVEANQQINIIVYKNTTSYHITNDLLYQMVDIEFTELNYKITYKSEGSEDVIKYTNDYAPIRQLGRTGYQFGGWSIDGVNAIDLSTTLITGDTELIAIWYPLAMIYYMYTETVQWTLHSSDVNGKFTSVPTFSEYNGQQFCCWSTDGTYANRITADQIKANTYELGSITRYYAVYHDWNIVYEVEPTCTTSGNGSKTCKNCNTTVSTTFDALGHEYLNGVCSRCFEYAVYGINLSSTTGYTWALHSDGYYYPMNGGNKGLHSTQADFTYTAHTGGSLTFEWAQSSEAGYDYLEVYKNNTLIQTYKDWSTTSYKTSSAIQVLEGDIIKFRYRKDGSGENGWDQTRIRNIKIDGILIDDLETVVIEDGTYTVSSTEGSRLSVESFTIANNVITNHTYNSGWEIYGDAGSESLEIRGGNIIITYAANSIYALRRYGLKYDSTNKTFTGYVVYNVGQGYGDQIALTTFTKTS